MYPVPDPPARAGLRGDEGKVPRPLFSSVISWVMWAAVLTWAMVPVRVCGVSEWLGEERPVADQIVRRRRVGGWLGMTVAMAPLRRRSSLVSTTRSCQDDKR